MSMIAGVKKNGSPRTLAGVTINGRFLDFHTVGGSSLAGPMWAKAMQVIQEWLPSVQFDTPPETKPSAPKKVRKPSTRNEDTAGDNDGNDNGRGNDTGGGGGRG
jgi:hypothetical protein